MANVRKKISDLTALTSASLDTTLVGVDNGVTYKIELDTLADAVTSRVNILDRSRLSSLESVTSSFETKGNSIISSSAQITALGFISSSQSINTGSLLSTSSFNSFSASIHSEILAATNEQDLTPYVTDIVYQVLSGSVDGRLDNLEINSGSYLTSLNGAISSSSQLTSSYDSRYVLSGSITQTTWDNISGKPAGLVSQSTDLSSINQFTQSIDSRVDNLELNSGSYLTSLNGTISSSAQVVDILTSLNAVSHSHSNKTELDTINQNLSTTSNVQFHDLAIAGTGSFQSNVTIYGNLQVWGTQSVINSTNVELSDNILYLAPSGGGDFDLGIIGHYNDGTYSHAGIFSDASDGHAWKVFKGLTTETTGAYVDTNGAGYTLADFKANNIYGGIYATNDVVSGSSQLTASYDNRYTLSGSVSAVPSGTISGSSQLTSSFDTRYAPSASYLTSLNGAYSSSIQTLGGSGVYSSSAQLPSGLISGSSQLTASYDTRYTLSGSVSAVPAGTISGSAQITAFGFVSSSTSVPAGTISGSSQLTSSFDGRYVQTGSFNTLTASFNSFTASAQAVTTGSNSFNGTQTITGSLIITTGSFVGSQILANTSSLYLTSGSNMYVQNNGVVEITGSLRVSGSANFNVNVLSVDGRSGDEGGEINLAIPATNTTLENRVTTDVWQNRYRIFEGSANAKGVFVDLSKAPAGVGGELTWKASGLVNTGVDVTLGDLKARIPSTGNKSLQLSTTTGVTYSVYGSSIYSQGGSVIGLTINATSPLSVSTTPVYLASGNNFGTAGATDTWVIMDTSNTIAWRITMILGAGFNNNMISIERLV